MFTERVGDFFSTKDFAMVATWTPSSGGPQQSASVIKDSPDELLRGNRPASGLGDVMTREYTILLQTAEFGGLKIGETITMEGANYKVRDVRLIEDGKTKAALLSKV
jgi:hypothetical protein